MTKFVLVAVQLCIVVSVVAADDNVKLDGDVYSWVPTKDCTAPEQLQLCYQDKEETITFLSKFDILNPCYSKAEVMKGNCVQYGYSKYLFHDPVFRTSALYGKADYPSAELMFFSGAEDGACWKDLHYRGVGRFSSNCTKDEEKEMGFCFPECPAGQSGAGPFCLNKCVAPYYVSEGALCCKTKEVCTKLITQESFKLASDLAKTIIDANNDPKKLPADIEKMLGDASELLLPACSKAPEGDYSMYLKQ
mmetsp:Transcript_1275/g.1626  ORF Transcript_1275/g.1626 Transcript_1275/m.1626 type:complete len:249 (-) Transcript_1275:232-978(-)|eukprot:CAMPEP_0204836968 /NCGR_PEP_ID=MMETSP1346-20131115/26745_1 /ASSEMBLY_ACC=CAM_ASM_000771 /TAXON_ID=215587 /ORGANISM="Aplanochytrium stocchinoi, Strain GSBS06" /LENGTH=248 /DNA_ID=CAMNT_0051972133 /DNA_START=58 /DNA_END=804 /DNA_ORIENTATION=-